MVACISVVALLMLAQVAINQLNNEVIEEFAAINTHHDLKFQVHYVQNNMFEENPIPQDFNFLMSFTDYILVTDSFNISISKPTNIYYDFLATKRLVVTSPDAGYNVVVFEQSTILDESSGQSHGTNIQISGAGGFLDESTGFSISPRDYIFWYRQFTEYHQRQMIREDVMGLGGGRNLSAELRVDFSYNIHLPEINHRESSTRGFNIPLGNEIYNLTASGNPSNESRVLLSQADISPANAPPIFVFVVGVLICLAALIWSFMMFMKEEDQKVQKTQIPKKYSDNLIITNSPVDISSSIIVTVKDFKEMLKLSTWLSKPIIYYPDSTDADFILPSDGFTYVFSIATIAEVEPETENEESNLALTFENETPVMPEVQTQAIEFEAHLKRKREDEPDRYIPKRARRAEVLSLAPDGILKDAEIPINILNTKPEPQPDVFSFEEAEEDIDEEPINVRKRSRFAYSKLM